MQNKDILPLKEVFPRTTTHALLTNELYTNLQRAVSSPEYFYKGNPERFEKGNKKVNKEIYDTLLHYLVVDTNRIPPRFLELFDREEEH
ncbi:MAG: hypothetical protein LBD75_00930 [Candidatus Peribacteria bacterium]|nr:hypothetical protein [Candidatus Peribacteria bacterium]